MAKPGSGRIPKVYALADLDALNGLPLAEAVGRMADGGIRWVQVRAKNVSDGDLASGLDRCCRVLEGAETELWINDRPDLACMYPVRGVHLGQDDLPPGAARRVLGEGRWIGRSTHNERQVVAADADAAVDVVAIGPVFPTRGKAEPEPTVGLEGVRRARSLTRKPLVAIGGIDESNLGEVLAAGADSAAMLGAVCRGEIEDGCRRLVALAEESV